MPIRFPALFAALALAAPAGASMTVGAFVAKANALRANPLTALTSPDFATLRDEAHNALQELRADRAQRAAAGKPATVCVPDGESIGPVEMVDALAALPAPDQRLPLKDGYAKVLARRFPCR
jgi:hypothetical protein